MAKKDEARVTIRLEDDIKESGAGFACADRCSLSSWIERAVYREVDQLEKGERAAFRPQPRVGGSGSGSG